MNTIRLYGISNCDTVRKARAWLDAQGIAHEFHDFRKQGLTHDTLRAWIAQLGWEALLNRRGTTWRQLSAEQQASVADADSACALMLSQVSVIKRPVVEWNDSVRHVTVGFDPTVWPPC